MSNVPDKKIQLCATVDRHSKQEIKGSSRVIYTTVATKSKQNKNKAIVLLSLPNQLLPNFYSKY